MCVAYNYPSCPLRLDHKQINSHVMQVGARGSLSIDAEIKERLKEGYGPGGQGPLPPFAVGFANCCGPANCGQQYDEGPYLGNDGPGWGGSYWAAKLSECSGRESVFSGSANAQGFMIPVPPSDNCDSAGSGITIIG